MFAFEFFLFFNTIMANKEDPQGFKQILIEKQLSIVYKGILVKIDLMFKLKKIISPNCDVLGHKRMLHVSLTFFLYLSFQVFISKLFWFFKIEMT